VDKYRAYGIRLQFYFQSIGQLKKCFPDGQDQTFLSNVTQVYAGVNDLPTAEYVSKRLGEATIVTRSGGTNSGSSITSSVGGSSRGSSSGQSDNWQQTARQLLKPEEVMALDERTGITFTPGVPPIRTRLVRAYEEPHLGRLRLWERFKAAADVFTGSLLLMLGSGLLAMAFSKCSQDRVATKQTPARNEQQFFAPNAR